MTCAHCSKRIRRDGRAYFGWVHVPDRGFRGHYAMTSEQRDAQAWERSQMSRSAA